MKKGLIKLIFAIFTFVIFFISNNELYSQNIDANTYDSMPCETFANKREWRYKTENGKLYRRLYDTTTLVWVGDWILIG